MKYTGLSSQWAEAREQAEYSCVAPELVEAIDHALAQSDSETLEIDIPVSETGMLDEICEDWGLASIQPA